MSINIRLLQVIQTRINSTTFCKIRLLSQLLLLSTFHSFGQSNICNCQKFQNGNETVLQCPISPIAGDNSLHVGIGIGKTSTYKYIALIIRFQAAAQKVQGALRLTFSNGSIIELPSIIQSKLGVIGNSQICSGNFKLNKSAISLLSKYPLKTIAFHLDDELLHMLKAETNTSALIDQIKCL